MPGTQDEAAQDDWKRKYFDSLEDLEAREKQWGRIEHLLRSAMIRMSLAVSGMDDDLDGQLDRLRRELRSGDPGDQWVELTSAINTRLEQLEQSAGPTPTDALVQLLDQIEMPRGVGRRARSLRKRLARADDDEGVTSLVKELADLIKEALSSAGAPDEAPRGLLGRLRRSGGPAGGATESGAESDDGVSVGRDVLEGVLGRAQLEPRRRSAVEPIQARVRQAASAEELMGLARQLGAALSDAAPAPGPQQAQGPALNEALLQLLERLELPGDFQEDLEQLQQRLETPVGADEWPNVLGSIAHLVGRLRTNVQREKQDLEQFLANLTGRLEELDAHLQHVETDRRDAVASGRNLDQAVQEQVQGIHSSVADASELGQLKKSIEQRLDAINNHMQEFRRTEESRNTAAEERIQALNERLRGMEQETTQLRNRVKEERRLAVIDSLTEVHNRMAYEERIEEEYARWKRFGGPLSVVLIDIDNFKDVNDTYGHKAGDKVLRTIAGLLNSRIRETDFLARYGGEEFVVLMPGAEPANAKTVADELRHAVQECGFHYRGAAVSVTISCGVAGFRTGDQPENVFERADMALYRAKETGRNRSVLAED